MKMYIVKKIVGVNIEKQVGGEIECKKNQGWKVFYVEGSTR